MWRYSLSLTYLITYLLRLLRIYIKFYGISAIDESFWLGTDLRWNVKNIYNQIKII